MQFPLRSLLATAALTAAMLLPHAGSAEDKPLSKEEVKAIVKQVIRENPDLLFEVLADYEEKTKMARISRTAVNLSKMQDKLITDPQTPSIGNPKGSVTVVEFFDYHCGFCKRFFPEIVKLIQDDKDVRVVFKEFPILSVDSNLASKAALAVHSVAPDKYFDYHILLMNSKSEFTQPMLTDYAKQLGIDEAAFKKAFEDPVLGKQLDANKELADSLDITATPTIVVGTEVMPGAITYETLKQKVEAARDNQKQRSGQ